MLETAQFTQLIRRVRSGDQDAAVALVRQFEPFIHREIRLRLEDQQLRQAYDTVDVSQSVLGSFFVRAAVGEFDVGSPDQLLRLLMTITRRKVAALARRERRQKRDRRRQVDNQQEILATVPGREPTPSAIASSAELIERAKSLLSDEVRAIVELRGADCSWQQVAERMGGTSQGRRVQLMRAMKRVMQQLGFEDVSHA